MFAGEELCADDVEINNKGNEEMRLREVGAGSMQPRPASIRFILAAGLSTR